MRVKVSRVSDLWRIYFCLQLTQLKKIEDEAPAQVTCSIQQGGRANTS